MTRGAGGPGPNAARRADGEADPPPGHAAASLVTGASAGLGLAITRALIARGERVVGVDRDPSPLHGAAGAAGYAHERVDLADADAVDALLDRLAGTRLRAAHLVAGISATGRFEALPPEAHRRVLRINAEAPLVIADGLRGRGLLDGTGVLVLVASLSVDLGYPGAASYAASKDALHAYGRSLGAARRARGAAARVPRTLTVLPGPLRTDHAARHSPEGAKAETRMTPEDCAARILRAADRLGARGAGGGRHAAVLRPGAAAGAAGLFGRLLPGQATRLMRRVLFDRLDREVW